MSSFLGRAVAAPRAAAAPRARVSRVAAAAKEAAWAPGNESPVHLDGTLPGDMGFDPLNLGEDPQNLAWYSAAELIHARFAMLASAGAVAPALFGKVRGVSCAARGGNFFLFARALARARARARTAVLLCGPASANARACQYQRRLLRAPRLQSPLGRDETTDPGRRACERARACVGSSRFFFFGVARAERDERARRASQRCARVRPQGSLWPLAVPHPPSAHAAQRAIRARWERAGFWIGCDGERAPARPRADAAGWETADTFAPFLAFRRAPSACSRVRRAPPQQLGVSWPGAGVEWYEMGTYDGYWISTNTLLTVQFLFMGWAETRRYMDLKNPGSANQDPFFDYKVSETDAIGYPGSAFDPLGRGKGSDLAALKLKEIKNGRLAMLCTIALYAQYAATGVGPLDNLGAHLADPWNNNIITTFSDAFIWDYSDLSQSWVAPVLGSGVGYPAL